MVLSETIVAPAKHKEENGTNSQPVENLDKRQRLQSMLQVAARSGRKDETRGRTDTEGFVIKETVEVFVETEAGRDRAVGHDLSLNGLDVRGSQVVGRAPEVAILSGVEHHMRRATVLGGVRPEFSVPLDWRVAAVVADVTLAV